MTTIEVSILPSPAINTTVNPSASSIETMVPSAQPSSFVTVEPVGTASEQTAQLAAVFARAMRANVAVILSGNYSVNGPISLTQTGVLRIDVRNRSTITYVGNAALNYLLRVNSAENSVWISGQPLAIDGGNLVRSAIRLDRTDTTAGGVVFLSDVSISNCRNTDNGVSIQVAGVESYGYRDVIYNRCSATNIRNTGSAVGTAVVGLCASNYHRGCRMIDCQISDVRNTLLADADGIKAFGRGQIEPPTYRSQRASIEDCTFTDCQGRAVKIQTSESVVRRCQVKQLTVPTIPHGVGIAFQWGNGLVQDCSFEFAKDMVGESYSVVNFQNVLGDAKLQKSVIDGLTIESVDSIPRIVLVGEESTAQHTAYEVSRVLGSRSSGSLVSRALIEIVEFQKLITKGKRTQITVKDCEYPTDLAVVGYTGYTSGAFPLLSVDISNIRNTIGTVDNNCRPFNNISGNRLLSFQFRFANLNHINSVFSTSFHCDFATLASTSFGFLLGGENVTVANGPAGLPNGLYWVEAMGQWFPASYNFVRLTNLDTGATYIRQHSTWLQVITP